MSDIIWTMEQDYCDSCGVYLYADGMCDDNSGMCSVCFDAWVEDEWSDEEEDNWDDDGAFLMHYFEEDEEA